MSFDQTQVKNCIHEFDFKKLFIEELGWDTYSTRLPITVDGQEYVLHGTAEKRGMAVLICQSEKGRTIPDYQTRLKIDRQVAKSVHEHLIVYVDEPKMTQVWQWVRKEPGRPVACRLKRYDRGQTGEPLVQALQHLAFTLEEEDELVLVDVVSRARAAFDVERVTKRFYDRFKKEHDVFLEFIDGIPDDELQRWYASVMLNRLMFIYFIQKKGFLGSDIHYLKNKLAASKKRGKDFFYAGFLCPLFFEGFAKKSTERSPEINQLLGTIPYLNGGLFMRHQVEELHGQNIHIADKAFEKLLDFFDQYQWHLDERPLRADNEINPDVLGYIFEKYINQKQMGAYYTKEDITEYISKNTVIPFLFDQARELCAIAFEGDQSVWQLLQSAPDRYIYEAVRRGVIDEPGNIITESGLPDFVQKGMRDPKERMFDKRYNLGEAFNGHQNKDKFALPTETWREYIERRKRCLELRQKLAAGEIQDINDLITCNLDIRQFAQDVVENCEGPELLRAFYQAIENVTVLDPTCGSGAFLFAALNILEPLYEACLNRMEVFIQESALLGDKPERYEDFREILKRVSEHPNLSYFIFKSIILNNLYGVDIMEEAIEICKLRLFLKLVAQINDVNKIEPLPDIDFNIRAGNTLVGFTSLEEVEMAMTSTGAQARMISPEENEILKRLKQKGNKVAALFTRFREKQTSLEGEATKAEKEELQNRLRELEDELNGYLATDYGADLNKPNEYEKWLHSPKPFHWFIEFYGIMSSGGFDVIIGNPPYVEYRNVRAEYQIKGFSTERCNDLYAYILERSLGIQRDDGYCGFIVPVSFVSTDGFLPLRTLVTRECGHNWFSTYAMRPSKLFEGADKHLCIWLAIKQSLHDESANNFCTKYHRWLKEERETLLQLSRYVRCRDDIIFLGSIPKVGSNAEVDIMQKLITQNLNLGNQTDRFGSHVLYHTRKLRYFVQFLNQPPKIIDEKGNPRITSELKELRFREEIDRNCALAVCCSTLFFWYFLALSDCRNVNKREVHGFPIDLSSLATESKNYLSSLSMKLMSNLQQNSEMHEMSYREYGRLRVQAFAPRLSKLLVDNIDQVLAEYYHFTDEELDFIVNYDIKYRMGQDADEEGNISQAEAIDLEVPEQKPSLFIVKPEQDKKFKEILPLFSLKAAAGKFSDGQDVEAEGWVKVDIGRKLDDKMFVAHVVGKSMEPKIPDGSFCVFRAHPEGSRQGKIVLVQHHDIDDPETGGSYTIKVYTRTEEAIVPNTNWKRKVVLLKPINPDYEPIRLTDADENDVHIIAELITVLPNKNDRRKGKIKHESNRNITRTC